MAKDLADYQTEAIANGYTHDFGFDGRSAPADITNELRIVEYVSFDSGTDPGDDVAKNGTWRRLAELPGICAPIVATSGQCRRDCGPFVATNGTDGGAGPQIGRGHRA